MVMVVSEMRLMTETRGRRDERPESEVNAIELETGIDGRSRPAVDRTDAVTARPQSPAAGGERAAEAH